MKSIILARVSTQEQKEAGNSLPAQLERIKSYCYRKGLDVLKEFSFDESAYKDKRDEFDKLIEYVQAVVKKEKVAVCFDKVDRLSRSVFDKRVGTLYDMALNDRIELHFVSDGQTINNQMSAVEKFQFGMSLGLAKYYSDAISDNVKRALEQKRRNGEWTGQVRLGYLNVPLDVENRTRKDIVVDPERSHLIVKMFDLYATGNYSLETIRIQMTGEGLKNRNGKELCKSNVENILKDSFFCGTAMSKKYGPYVHQHPRLISKEVYNKCQEIRAKRKKVPNKEKSKDFALKGILKCHNCGCNITAEQIKKKNGNIYNYYSCTNGKKICKRIYVSEKELLEPVHAILDRLQGIPADVQDKLVTRLRELNESQVQYHNSQMLRIKSEHTTFQNRKNNLIDMYADQSITKPDYDKKMQEYQDKMQSLEMELSEHTKADNDYKTTISTVFTIAMRAKDIFDSSEVNEKRQILSYLLQNSTLDQRKPYFIMRSPFNLILDLSDHPIWLRE